MKNKQPLTQRQNRIINQAKFAGIALGVLSSILFNTYGFINIWVWLFVIASIIVLMVGTIHRLTKPPALPNLQFKQDPELKRQLIRMCGGDRELAERLIGLERGDCKAAIERLMRDRR